MKPFKNDSEVPLLDAADTLSPRKKIYKTHFSNILSEKVSADKFSDASPFMYYTFLDIMPTIQKINES